MGQDPAATGSGARERGQPLRAGGGIAALGLLAFLLTACGSPGVASSQQSVPQATLASAPARGEMVAALAAEPVADRPAPLIALFRAL